MRETVSLLRFKEGFREIDSEGVFSDTGLDLLFQRLEEIEEDTGQEIEYNPVSFCERYEEHSCLRSFQSKYDPGYKSLDDIAERTEVISNNWKPDEIFIILKFHYV